MQKNGREVDFHSGWPIAMGNGDRAHLDIGGIRREVNDARWRNKCESSQPNVAKKMFVNGDDESSVAVRKRRMKIVNGRKAADDR